MASKSNAVASTAGPSLAHPRRWIPIGLLSLAALINYLDRGSLSVALPFVARDMHLDPLQQGWALAAFSVTYTLFQLPAGWFVDRWSLKGLYAAAFALWCVASAATGIASNLAMLIFFRLLLGIGESINLPGGLKFISEQFGPHERTVPSAIFDVGCKAGLAIGLVVEAWILRNFGWRWMFLSTGLFGLLWLLPWLVLYPAPSQTASPSRNVVPWRVLRNIVSQPQYMGNGGRLLLLELFLVSAHQLGAVLSLHRAPRPAHLPRLGRRRPVPDRRLKRNHGRLAYRSSHAPRLVRHPRHQGDDRPSVFASASLWCRRLWPRTA